MAEKEPIPTWTVEEIAEMDVDDKMGNLQNWWKLYNNNKTLKKDGWVLISNEFITSQGNGFESFKAAMKAISDGYGWDDEAEKPMWEEQKAKKHAYPILALYHFATEDNPKRIKNLAFAYCDDSKNYGMKPAKKMRFARWKDQVKDAVFGSTIHGGIQQWGSEAEIQQDAMLTIFKKGDFL